jgi:peroxiredoxin 2/4
MARLVGRPAPDFTAKAVLPDGTMADLTLSSYKGKYVILLFYPLDFTFVCPSEILAFDKALDWFRQKNCEVLAVSIDSEFTHLAWRNTPLKEGGIGNVAMPMLSDITKGISRAYDVLINESMALRGLFLLDREGIVRHELVNDLPLGRSVHEAKRILEALQFTEAHGEVCPANWHAGEEGMVPTREGVANYLSNLG